MKFEEGAVMVYARDFSDRFLEFSVLTIRFLNSIPYKKEYEVFRYQLSKSATSIGANYEESQASSSKEFYHRVSICLREARETYYWLRIINKLNLGDDIRRAFLLKESNEIMLMLGSIHSKHFRETQK